MGEQQQEQHDEDKDDKDTTSTNYQYSTSIKTEEEECLNKNIWKDDVYVYNGGKVERHDKRRIRHVVISKSVIVIASQAFQQSHSLLTVEMEGEDPNASSSLPPETSSSVSCSLQVIGCRAFFGCTSLTTFVMPDSVRLIAKQAFSNCHQLKTPFLTSSSSFSSSLQLIGKEAFSCCHTLTRINFPSSLEKLALGAFYDCEGLKYIHFYSPSSVSPSASASSSSLTDEEERNGKKGQKGLQDIARSAFFGCERLETVVLPDTLREIGKDSFSCCTVLKNIIFSENHGTGRNNSDNNVDHEDELIVVRKTICLEKIGHEAFSHCSFLDSITIPNSVSYIGYRAFAMSGLKTINIPKSVRFLGPDTFLCCYSLQSAILRGPASTTGNGTFHRCKNLKHVTIPNTTETIGTSTFYGCTNLTTVDFLPRPEPCSPYNTENKVTAIVERNDHCHNNTNYYSNAYCRHDGIATLRLPETIKKIGANTFVRCDSLINVMNGQALIFFCDVNAIRQNFLQKQRQQEQSSSSSSVRNNKPNGFCPAALWSHLLSKVQEGDDLYYYDNDDNNNNGDDENDFTYLYLTAAQKHIRTTSILFYLLMQGNVIFGNR